MYVMSVHTNLFVCVSLSLCLSLYLPLPLLLPLPRLLLPFLSRCRNCGSTAHRSWECPEQLNVTSSVICSRCGGGGHIASDCMVDL